MLEVEEFKSAKDILLFNRGEYDNNLEKRVVAAISLDNSLLSKYRSALLPEMFTNDGIVKIIKSLVAWHDSGKKINWDLYNDQDLFLEATPDLMYEISRDANNMFGEPDENMNSCLSRLIERHNLRLLSNFYQESLKDNFCQDLKTHTEKSKAVWEQIDINSRKLQKNTFEQNHVANKSVEIMHKLERKLNGEVVEAPRISSGYKGLDAYLSKGYKQGMFYLCAGKPGMGKTCFAVNQLFNCASEDVGVLYISYEVSEEALHYQIISTASGIPTENIEHLEFKDDEETALFSHTNMSYDSPVNKKKMTVKDPDDKTIEGLVQIVQDFKNENQLNMVIVDHIHKMQSATECLDYNMYNDILDRLVGLAKEEDIAILAFAQLNKKLDDRPDKKPQLGDLKDTSKFADNPDLIMMLHRPSYYEKIPGQTPESNDLEVFIRKSRFGVGAAEEKVTLNANLVNKQVKDKSSKTPWMNSVAQ